MPKEIVIFVCEKCGTMYRDRSDAEKCEVRCSQLQTILNKVNISFYVVSLSGELPATQGLDACLPGRFGIIRDIEFDHDLKGVGQVRLEAALVLDSREIRTRIKIAPFMNPAESAVVALTIDASESETREMFESFMTGGSISTKEGMIFSVITALEKIAIGEAIDDIQAACVEALSHLVRIPDLAQPQVRTTTPATSQCSDPDAIARKLEAAGLSLRGCGGPPTIRLGAPKDARAFLETLRLPGSAPTPDDGGNSSSEAEPEAESELEALLEADASQ